MRLDTVLVAAAWFWAIALPAQVFLHAHNESSHAQHLQARGEATADHLLRTFKTVCVHSDTIYLKTEAMRQALEQQPEFGVWGLAIVAEREAAEVVIEITRPFMTFDWKYSIVHQETRKGLGSGKVVAWDGKRAAPKLANGIAERIRAVRPLPVDADPAHLLRTFGTIRVHADTVYLKADVMTKALEQQPEFGEWGLAIAAGPEVAEVVIEITRPFMTFDWKYELIHQKTRTGLGSGKVVAWDGKRAAPKLATEIMKQIRTARPPPASDRQRKPPGVAGGTVALKGKRWSVRAVESGTQLTLTVNREEIVAQDKSEVLFSIPVNNVIAIGHDSRVSEVKNLAEPWWRFWGGGIDDSSDWYYGDSTSAGLTLVTIVAVGGVLEAIEELGKHKDHFVRIDWLEDSAVRGATFRVSSLKYKSLLAELQAVTEKEWKDLPECVRGVRQELMRELARGVPFEFDRKARVGWTELEPGTYRLVLLERGFSRGELYVLPNNAKSVKEVIAQAVVTIERSDSAQAETDSASVSGVEYREENGITTISRIRMGQRSLRLDAAPVGDPE